MEGIGNDYVYVDDSGEKLEALPGGLAAISEKVSDRHFGIGSDGLIAVQPSRVADFRMRMFNADGSEGEMCGNGIRCFSKFLRDQGLTDREELAIETGAGIKYVSFIDYRPGARTAQVCVDMDVPILEATKVPTQGLPVDDQGRAVAANLEVAGENWAITAVSMGNPHAVTWVSDPYALELEKIGPQFENHPAFPNRINTEFVRLVSDSEAQMRVWERGSGETWACGTGACAVAVAGILEGKLRPGQVTIHLRGGDLQIEWAGPGQTLYMMGAATTVFSGEYEL